MSVTFSLAGRYHDAIAREQQRLAHAGVWWTGAQRVAIAAAARFARGEGDPPANVLPDAALEAATRLSVDPHVDQAWIDQLVSRGLALEPYIEVLAIVSRMSALDTFLYGLALEPWPLPEPEPGGEPSRQVVAEAQIQGAFVPTVGVPFPPTALTAVPPAAAALGDLHGVLYLSLEEMGDQQIVKDLNRTQIELVAARTSLLNECFY